MPGKSLKGELRSIEQHIQRIQTSHLEISALYQVETMPGAGAACQKRTSCFVFSLFFFTSYTDEAFQWIVADRGRGFQSFDVNIVSV